MLRHLEQWLRSLHAWALCRPRRTLVLSSALIVFAALGLGRLTQVVSIRDQLDPGMASTRELRQMEDDFSGDPSLVFTLEAQGDSFTAQELCRLRQTIGKLEAQYAEIRSLSSPFDIRRAKASAEALHYPALIEDVCLGEPARRVALTGLAASPWGHLFVGPRERDLSFTVSLAPGPRTGTFGSFRPELVAAIIRSTTTALPGRVHVTGTAAQEFYTMQGLAEAQWLNLLVFVILGLGFRYFFGTWRASLTYGLTIVPTGVLVYGLMGWAGHPVDPLSVCLFLMLAIASIEDFVFLSQEMAARPEAPLRAFEVLLLPSFMTSLTTVMAFGSLSFSSLESIRRFGAWAALGGAVEWLILFICLPALLRSFPRLSSWVRASRSSPMSWATRLLRKNPPRLVARLALVAFVFAIISVRNFNLAQTPTDVFPKDHPLQTSIDRILSERGWVASVGLVYSETASDELKVAARQTVQADPIVFRSESWPSVVSFVAGEATSPLARSMIERELSITDVSRGYRSRAGRERDVLYLRSSNTAEINRLRSSVEAQCPRRECWLTGEFVAFADFSQQLIETLFESLFASLLVVALIIGYTAWERGHLRLVPGFLLSSFFGPAIMLTVIYAFGLSVNFVTCVVASTLIGLTGDNALMFLLTEKGNLSLAVEARGLAAVQTAIVMALCSLTFVFSYFEPPRMLGLLLATGFLFSVLGDVWLLKGLLPKSSHD